jgi:hypothetical protein
MKTLVTFIKFHRVIQLASCDQIGDYRWLNCSWIINEFEKWFSPSRHPNPWNTCIIIIHLMSAQSQAEEIVFFSRDEVEKEKGRSAPSWTCGVPCQDLFSSPGYQFWLSPHKWDLQHRDFFTKILMVQDGKYYFFTFVKSVDKGNN